MPFQFLFVNIVFLIQFVQAGNAYTVTVIQDDVSGAHSAWTYFETDMGNINAQQASINIVPADTGTEVIWTFNKDGILTLPNGATIKDTVGNSVAFGLNAGNSNQGIEAVAVGDSAGNVSQGGYAVALGFLAGTGNQGWFSVAAGYSAGYNNQANSAVAVGSFAGALPFNLFSLGLKSIEDIFGRKVFMKAFFNGFK